MARQQKDATYDNATLLKDSAAVAADAAAQVAAVNRILDLGLARMDGRVIADVTVIDVSSADEFYVISAQFSNSSTFASGVIGGAAIRLGAAAALIGESAATVIGRYEFAFTNEINGVLYRYMRLYTDVGGTTPTITYSAFLANQAF
jgi:hypothetical protein